MTLMNLLNVLATESAIPTAITTSTSTASATFS